MKDLGNFLLGIILTIVGFTVFLSNIQITSFSLYRYNGVNVGGFLIVLLIISFITFLVKTNWLTGIIFGIIVLMFLVSLILSISFVFRSISAFYLVLILGCICIGVALILRGVFGIKSNKK